MKRAHCSDSDGEDDDDERGGSALFLLESSSEDSGDDDNNNDDNEEREYKQSFCPSSSSSAREEDTVLTVALVPEVSRNFHALVSGLALGLWTESVPMVREFAQKLEKFLVFLDESEDDHQPCKKRQKKKASSFAPPFQWMTSAGGIEAFIARVNTATTEPLSFALFGARGEEILTELCKFRALSSRLFSVDSVAELLKKAAMKRKDDPRCDRPNAISCLKCVITHPSTSAGHLVRFLAADNTLKHIGEFSICALQTLMTTTMKTARHEKDIWISALDVLFDVVSTQKIVIYDTKEALCDSMTKFLAAIQKEFGSNNFWRIVFHNDKKMRSNKRPPTDHQTLFWGILCDFFVDCMKGKGASGESWFLEETTRRLGQGAPFFSYVFLFDAHSNRELRDCFRAKVLGRLKEIAGTEDVLLAYVSMMIRQYGAPGALLPLAPEFVGLYSVDKLLSIFPREYYTTRGSAKKKVQTAWNQYTKYVLGEVNVAGIDPPNCFNEFIKKIHSLCRQNIGPKAAIRECPGALDSEQYHDATTTTTTSSSSASKDALETKKKE